MEYDGRTFLLFDIVNLITESVFAKTDCSTDTLMPRPLRFKISITTDSIRIESIMDRMRYIRLLPVLYAATAIRAVASRKRLPSRVGLIL